MVDDSTLFQLWRSFDDTIAAWLQRHPEITVKDCEQALASYMSAFPARWRPRLPKLAEERFERMFEANATRLPDGKD